MKKNKTILLVALLMAIVAALLIYFKSYKGTIREELKDFAISDTSSITKIFLADKKGKQVLLEKIAPGDWKVNGKFTARRDAINTLLYTMKNLEVKSPVARSAYNNVIKNMASKAIKTEIYQQGELTKTYYVGEPAADQLGTFMMLENSSAPFIMQIPGFDGYLTTRYFTSESDWRDRTIFRYKPEDIASISVEHFFATDRSFTLTAEKGEVVGITAKNTGEKMATPDSVRTKLYMNYFRNVEFEALVVNNEEVNKDSVIANGPVYVITLTDVGGKINKVKIFLKPVGKSTNTADTFEGKAILHDIDRMYALVNNDKDFVMIQNFIFDNLLRGFKDFAKKK